MSNLACLKVLKSLVSNEQLTHMYNWGYNYYTVTEKGLTYLREQLGIADQKVVPKTYATRNAHRIQEEVAAEEQAPQEGTPAPRGTRGRGGRGGF